MASSLCLVLGIACESSPKVGDIDANAGSGGNGSATTPGGAGGEGASAPTETAGAPDSAGAAGAGGAPTSPVPPPPDCNAETSGTYKVPVSPELEAYSEFHVDHIVFCKSGGNSVELGYTLPNLLVGDDQDLSFSGEFDATADAIALSGAHGNASCTQTAGVWHCAEQLANIQFDASQLQQRLQDRPADEAQARMDVASQFSNDPIGVISFTTE